MDDAIYKGLCIYSKHLPSTVFSLLIIASFLVSGNLGYPQPFEYGNLMCADIMGISKVVQQSR